ncbi:MAG: hypothetical protein ABIF06_01265 [bacterium]
MFKQLESELEWLEDRNIFLKLLVLPITFVAVLIVGIVCPLSFGVYAALALIIFQGYLAWGESPKLLILSVLLFIASWVISGRWGEWSYDIASGLGLAGLGIFILTSLRGPSFLDRLK